MNFIVYKTTNLKNSKIYIGVHYCDPNIQDGYIGCGVSKKDLKKSVNVGFPKAVHKYGYKNFKRETLYVFDDSEEGMKLAYQKEAELVNQEFIDRPDTYNISLGGKHPPYDCLNKKINQYTLDGQFIKTWESITSAEAEYNLTSISNNLRGVSKYCGDYQWKYYNGSVENIDPVITKEKTVYQFSLNGDLLKVWKSASLAASTFINKSARVSICNVCNNITRQAFGYYWSYKPKFEYNPYNGCTAVAMYSDDGTFIKSFTSLKEAAESVGLNTTSNIIAAIKGTQKHCGGYRWRYFYGNTSNIKPLR